MRWLHSVGSSPKRLADCDGCTRGERIPVDLASDAAEEEYTSMSTTGKPESEPTNAELEWLRERGYRVRVYGGRCRLLCFGCTLKADAGCLPFTRGAA